MDLKTWQDGLKLCRDNIVRLKDDGILLREHGSYGHAYFSFYTAMEELWKAYLIIENFYQVNTKTFLKYLKSHRIKCPYAIYRVFFDDISKLYVDDIMEFMKLQEKTSRSLGKYQDQIELDSKDMKDTFEYKYGQELDEYFSIWEKRNRIYLSLSEDGKEWITDSDITKKELENFAEKLEKAIEILDRMVTYLFVYRDNPVF